MTSERRGADLHPRIALADDKSGEPLDLTAEQARLAVERFPELRFEWRKWLAKTGGGGRLVVIHPGLIASVKAEILES